MINDIKLEIGIVQKNNSQQIGSIQLTDGNSRPIRARFAGASGDKYAKYIRRIADELFSKFRRKEYGLSKLECITVSIVNREVSFKITDNKEIKLNCPQTVVQDLTKLIKIADFRNSHQANE